MHIINIVSTNQVRDSSVAFFEDGKLMFASEEERYTGKKHESFMWPAKALAKAMVNRKADFSAYGWNLEKFLFKRKVDRYAIYPSNLLPVNKRSRLMDILPKQINQKVAQIHYSNLFRKSMKKCNVNRRKIAGKSMIFPHHLSHAAGAFFSSGFKKSNILIMDGSGEEESCSMYSGNGSSIEKIESVHSYNSLGTFYSIVTYMLGMGWSGEGKTMGLAPYGKIDPKLLDMIKITDQGYDINMNRVKGLAKYNRYGKITKKHCNLAATAQYLIEKAAQRLSENLYDNTGYKNLVIGGGVGLNCKLNGHLAELPFVRKAYTMCAPGDNGIPIGASLLGYRELGKLPKFKMDHAYYGDSFERVDIVRDLVKFKGITYEELNDVCSEAAKDLANDKVIGWFQGNMEFGPRALGNRSILAGPGSRNIRDRVNDIKNRERWRPLAPSLCMDDMKKYFETKHESPFMSFSFQVKEDYHDKLKGITHVDGSARLQTVSDTNSRFKKLIKTFGKESGVSVVMNTSFNDRGQPIVRTPNEAVRSFLKMGLDKLYIGDFVVNKK